jgi:uncharacterized protein (UPF0276 family)
MRRRLGKHDNVGLGWRAELGPSILSNLDQIDVVEVIVDDYFGASRSKLRSLNTLASQVPVLYHGVGLGLATSHKVDQKRLEKLGRVLDCLAPEVWSEHLSFVRADNIEIGHLAAPPRTLQTIEGTLANLELIKKVVGSYPVLENIATLIDPPGSKMSEPQWVNQILRQSGCKMLLDLHNLYSNAINFGFEPFAFMKSFPLDQVQLVHLSGGHWIKEPVGYESRPSGERMLDDHIHDVPDAVFDLLGLLAETVAQPLTVIIERDGDYPDFQILLSQIDRAKTILRNARERQSIHRGGLLEFAVI